MQAQHQVILNQAEKLHDQETKIVSAYQDKFNESKNAFQKIKDIVSECIIIDGKAMPLD